MPILCQFYSGTPGLIGVIEEDTDLYKIVEVLHLINGMPMTMNQAAETKMAKRHPKNGLSVSGIFGVSAWSLDPSQ